MRAENGLIGVVIGLIAVDILRYIGMGGALEGTDATLYSTLIIYISFFWLLKSQNKIIRNSKELILKIWLIILMFGIFYGIILASDYWDYKHLLVNVLGFSVTPLFYFLGLKIGNIVQLKDFFYRFVFVLGVVLIPLGATTNHELYARVMIPITFLLLFTPYLGSKDTIIGVSVFSIAVFTAPDFRSFQIKIIIVLILVFGYYIRRWFTKRIMLYVHSVLVLLPFILVIAAIYYDYNIFRDGLNPNEDEYIVVVGDEETNILGDTRTFLYVEIFNDLKGKEWLIGRSATGSYQSSFFGDGGGDVNGKRYSCEVGILNILMRSGFIGVFTYMFLLYRYTRNAILRSSNYLISALALLLASRWPLTFIEEFTQYDLNFFMFWLLMGFVSTPQVQNFTDEKLKTLFGAKFMKSSLKF